MDVKKIVLLIGALVIAAVAALTAKNMFTGASTPQAQAAAAPAKQVPEVLVATTTLPVGTIITADVLRYQPWPDGLVQPNNRSAGLTPKKRSAAVVSSARTCR